MIMDFNGMREKGIYDYVARNYYNLTKEELKNIALELSYTLNHVSKESESEVINTLEEDSI